MRESPSRSLCKMSEEALDELVLTEVGLDPPTEALAERGDVDDLGPTVKLDLPPHNVSHG